MKSHPEESDNEHFADRVSELEALAASGQQAKIFDPGSTLFRGSLVTAIVIFLLGCFGGVWGVAMAFANFESAASATRADIDQIRKDLAEIEKVGRRKRWTLQEHKWWVKALRDQNVGKIVVPEPADYTIERD